MVSALAEDRIGAASLWMVPVPKEGTTAAAAPATKERAAMPLIVTTHDDGLL